MGADIKLKQEFLKESIDDVLIRYEYVKKCVKLDNNIYLCVIDDRYSTKLDTALLADEMLKFEGFNVSIAIGKNSNDEVLISARSNGSIDVCKIMSKFGGGGRVGAAAATIKNSTIESVINKLKNVIKGE